MAEEEKETKDRYWELQITLVRLLQSAGLRVDVKDRLPIFRLFRVVTTRMTGAKAAQILGLLTELVTLRKAGLEPPFVRGKYE